jgi:hypothetical protein
MTRRAWLLLGLAVTLGLTAASWWLDARAAIEHGLTRRLLPLASSAPNHHSLDPAAFAPQRAISAEVGLGFLDADPGLPREMFRVEWTGVWFLERAGHYELYAGGDDRVVLRVNGVTVLDRDAATGSSTERRTLQLSRGFHRLEVIFEQRDGRYQMTVGWAPQGQRPRPFDPQHLFPSMPGPDAPALGRRLAALRHVVGGAWIALAMGFVLLGGGARTRMAPRADGRRSSWVGVSIVGLAFLGYFLNALHFEPLVFNPQQNLIFSADTFTTVGSMSELTFREHVRQHPLFSIVASSLVNVVDFVTPLGPNRSILAVVALIAAANCLFVYLIATRVLPFRLAVWLAVVYGSLFINLAIFSLPETYPLATLGVSIYLWYVTQLASPMAARHVLTLGLMTGVAGLLNPPLLSLGVVPFARLWREQPPRRALVFAGLSVMVAAAVFVIVNALIYGGEFYVNYLTDNRRYGRWAHFLRPDAIGLVFAGFYLYAVVSPLRFLTHHLTLGDAAGYADSATGIVLVTLYVVFLVLALAHALRSGDSLTKGVLLWLATMTAFYIYFNPPGVMLYTVQALPGVLLITARPLARMCAGSRVGLIGCGAFATLLILRNVPAIYAGVEIPGGR